MPDTQQAQQKTRLEILLERLKRFVDSLPEDRQEKLGDLVDDLSVESSLILATNQELQSALAGKKTELKETEETLDLRLRELTELRQRAHAPISWTQALVRAGLILGVGIALIAFYSLLNPLRSKNTIRKEKVSQEKTTETEDQTPDYTF